MNKIRNRQAGFSVIELLLILIFLAIVVLIGVYIAHNRSTKTTETTISGTAKTPTKTSPAPDPTADWTLYSSANGKFSVKYPQTWATAANPDLCASDATTGIFMLGATSSSVGTCASENAGQMIITWHAGAATCNDLSSNLWTQDSKQTVTVGGVSATKVEATAKAVGQGAGAYPEGTKTVQYCAVAHGTAYTASYIQLAAYPDVLSDFNTMVTKTLKFN